MLSSFYLGCKAGFFLIVFTCTLNGSTQIIDLLKFAHLINTMLLQMPVTNCCNIVKLHSKMALQLTFTGLHHNQKVK
jgi:hypothetical protein